MVGYILKRFPRLSETFILQELLELERQDVALQVYSLVDPTVDEPGEVRHGLLRELAAPIIYLPSNRSLKKWQIKRGRYRDGGFVEQAWKKVCGDGVPEGSFSLMQAAVVGVLARAQGVRHLHAHFATDAATVAMLASRLTGIPYSFTAHAKDIYDERVDRALLRKKIREARFVVTVSEYNRRHLEAFAGPRAARILRLYNGIDLARLAPDPRVPRESGLIVAAGRLVEKKGFCSLVQACRLLQERGLTFRCLIVGEGPERAMLSEAIETFGLAKQVCLTGALPQEELLEIMKRATVFVLPCVISGTGDRDALPTVLLEASALGVPAISTSLSGIPEIVAHGKTGLLVPPRDPALLAQAIEEVLNNPRLRERFAREGRSKAEEAFDIRKNVAILRDLFARSAGGQKVFDEDRVSHGG